MNRNLKLLVLTAIFCALSALGAFIKISGSVAFDALPAFLAAMLMGGPCGAIVGALGHMISALLAGFPLTLPMHLVIAAEMAMICSLAGVIARRGGKSIILAAAAAFVLNGLVAPAVLIVWPGMGWPVYVSYLLPLAIASLANAFLAAILYYPLRRPYNSLMGRPK